MSVQMSSGEADEEKARQFLGSKTVIEHVVRLFPGETDFVFICARDHLETTPLRSVLRRGLTEETVPEEPMPDVATVLARFGDELNALLGGEPRKETEEKKTPPPRPTANLEEQRVDLDGRLRAELERQGIVVTGKEVARVVASAVGKGIEWTG